MKINRIQNQQNVSFGYNHPLKTAFKKGLLPTVRYDIYGNKISPKKPSEVTLEHITPHSQGGKTVIDNLFLAEKHANWERGVKPIKEVVTPRMLFDYLIQFIGVKNKYINGDDYIAGILKKFKVDDTFILKSSEKW